MTAGTAVLALFPLLLSKGEPGKEILYPVAVVIVEFIRSAALLQRILLTIRWVVARARLPVVVTR